MTDISVFSQSLQTEDRSWDLTPDKEMSHDVGGTIDVSAFTQAQHFVNGFIPSGAVLCLFTGGGHSGFYGPYLDAGSNGQATAVGILRSSVTVVQPNGALKTKVGCAITKAFAVVSKSHLPFTSGTAAAGGYLDTDAQADLPLIYFDA